MALGPNRGASDERIPPAIPLGRRARNWEGLSLGLVTGIVYVMVAYVLVFHYGIVQDDAMSRVMNAYYIIFQKFHVAAIGFVWNPLPSLLALPLIIFHNAWQPLLTVGFAANIVSAVFGGMGAYYLVRILQHFTIPRAFRTVWVLLYVANPMILFYGSNGMTDVEMLSCFLAALDGLLRYVDQNQISDLVSSAIWLGMVFLIRYESVPYALCLGVTWGGAMIAHRVPFHTMVGRLAILALPITYLGTLWIFFNATIMGNPLYFADGPYSNASQMASGSYNWQLIDRASHHAWGSLMAIHHFTALFPPFMEALAIVGILAFWRIVHTKALILIGASVAVPLLQWLMLMEHDSAGWARFFMTFITMGFVLIAYAISRLADTKQRRKTWILVLGLAATASMAWGDTQTLAAMSNPVTGHGVYPLANTVFHLGPAPSRSGIKLVSAMMSGIRLASLGATLDHVNDRDGNPSTYGRMEAAFINNHPHARFLLDTFNFYSAVAFIKNPNQVVITSDPNFEAVLHSPHGRVNYLFDVPPSVSPMDAVNMTYPHLYTGGVRWVQAVHKFPVPGGAEVFKILPDAP